MNQKNKPKREPRKEPLYLIPVRLSRKEKKEIELLAADSLGSRQRECRIAIQEYIAKKTAHKD